MEYITANAQPTPNTKPRNMPMMKLGAKPILKSWHVGLTSGGALDRLRGVVPITYFELCKPAFEVPILEFRPYVQ